MEKKDKFLNRLITGFALDGEPMPGQVIVEIFDKNRVLIENHWGVVKYDESNIMVKARKGCIHIQGDRMSLTHMTKCRLVIVGYINCIEFI